MSDTETTTVPSRHWLLVVAAWQVVVWGTRIDNVMGDAGLTGGDKVLRVLLSATFLAFGVVAVWLWRQLVVAPDSRGVALASMWLRLGAAWTVLVWVVRGADIALGDHAVAFIVVHLVLGVVSIALAVQAVRIVGLGRVRSSVSPGATSGS